MNKEKESADLVQGIPTANTERKEIAKQFNVLDISTLKVIENVIWKVDCYTSDYHFSKNESSETQKIFKEEWDVSPILIDTSKNTIWFQDDSLFFELGCMDGEHRKFVENLILYMLYEKNKSDLN